MEQKGAECNQIAFRSALYKRSAPAPLVSLSSFSQVSAPSSPWLLSPFKTSPVAIPSAWRSPWVSPQEQLVNAEEISSPIAIGVGLTREENVGAEVFSPIQRFLILSAIGVAVAESKKNRIVNQLKKSLELRDEVLSSMEQKLDNLCDQLMNTVSSQEEINGCDRNEFVDRGSWNCDEHKEQEMGNPAAEAPRGDEVLQYQMTFTDEMEQEEQLMSDFSDWASSVSAEEIQMNNLALYKDFFSLKKEFDERDTIIKEGSINLQSLAGSKRIAELEDIIRRNDTMIERLKKDIVVLEEKADLPKRLQRPSYSFSISDNWELPVMVDNILYDLDSSSSSDSDSSTANQRQPPAVYVQETPVQKLEQSKGLRSLVGLPELHEKSRPKSRRREISTKRKPLGLSSSRPKQLSAGENIRKVTRKTRELQAKSRTGSPLRETSRNSKPAGPFSSRSKQLSPGGDSKKIRRQTQSETKDTGPKKRWV